MISNIIRKLPKQNIILFDLHGTLVSNNDNKIQNEIIKLIENKKQRYDVGILSGSELYSIKKILKQDIYKFDYVFSENGSQLYNPIIKETIYKNLIKKHTNYYEMLNLVNESNLYINYNLPMYSHKYFLQNRESMFTYKYLPYEHKMSLFYYLNCRKSILNLNDKISVLLSGNSLSIQPNEWNKEQVVNYIKFKYSYDKIYYFGDQFLPNHQDYKIINNPLVTGYPIKSQIELYDLLYNL